MRISISCYHMILILSIDYCDIPLLLWCDYGHGLIISWWGGCLKSLVASGSSLCSVFLLMVWSNLVVVVPSVSGSSISDVVTNLLGVAFSHPYSYLHVISKAVQWLSVSQLNIFCFWCVGVSLATHTHSYSFIFF